MPAHLLDGLSASVQGTCELQAEAGQSQTGACVASLVGAFPQYGHRKARVAFLQEEMVTSRMWCIVLSIALSQGPW
jgi:hypothetical protein